ncbi:hypothetical protein ABT031_20120, partial [Streptomyces sp. NPDC096934]
DRVRIEQGKVEAVLPRTGITEVDLIVLDPPRSPRARCATSGRPGAARMLCRAGGRHPPDPDRKDGPAGDGGDTAHRTE